MSLNLIDPQSIQGFLDGIADGDSHTAKLLKQVLAKPLANRAENLEPIRDLPDDAPQWLKAKWPEGGPYVRFSSDPELHGQVQHVADWIRSAIQDQDAWLSRVDEGSKDKKPFRFNNIHTLEDAVREADRDMMEKMLLLTRSLKSELSGETTVMELKNGYRIVQMETPEALDRESVKMGHCIGQGAYDSKLTSGSHRYLSLRDAKNEPHATLEIENASNMIIQCQGKENKTPKPEYIKYIAEYANEANCNVRGLPSSSGLVKAGEKVYSIHHIPANESISGDLYLRDAGIVSLPEGLKVEGSLDLRGTRITVLPKGLEVGDNLNLEGLTITNLPDDLKVGGNLSLENSSVTTLPKGLVVGRDLTLKGSMISELPEDLKVGRHLDLRNSRVSVLSKGLTVGGHLDLEGTAVKQLPEDLFVGRDLNLEKTEIILLPKTLNVCGVTHLGHSSRITQLPDDFHCKGSLSLKRSNITQLPANIKMDGALIIHGPGISEIPNNIRLGGDFILNSSSVSQLPDGLSVGGEFNVSRCNKLTSLPNRLKVGGALSVFESPICGLPDQFEVGESISIIRSNLKKLPDGLSVNGSLTLDQNPLQSLPEDLYVQDTLSVRETALSKLPEKMTVGSLDLVGTRVDSIPNGVNVRFDITMPDGERVRGNSLGKSSLEIQSAPSSDDNSARVGGSESTWTEYVSKPNVRSNTR